MIWRGILWTTIFLIFGGLQSIYTQAEIEVNNTLLLEQAANPTMVTDTAIRKLPNVGNTLFNVSGAVLGVLCVAHFGSFIVKKTKEKRKEN